MKTEDLVFDCSRGFLYKRITAQAMGTRILFSGICVKENLDNLILLVPELGRVICDYPEGDQSHSMNVSDVIYEASR